MGNQFASARNGASKTLLTAFVTAAVADGVQFSPPTQIAKILVVLAEKCNVVEAAVQSMDGSELDLFIMRLDKCVRKHEPFMCLVTAICSWIKGHPGLLATRYIESVVRVYCVYVQEAAQEGRLAASM
eukprot:SAG11_NODE_2679_length_3104_cov_3.342429_1_plen_128_part_00